MKWSWRIGRIAGIDIFMHATFLLLILWVAVTESRAGGDRAAILGSIGFLLLLFASVIAHEYGHALTARRFGVRTRRITLLPIGGLAELERMPDDPKQELLIAAAGPAVTLLLVVLLAVAVRLSGMSYFVTSASAAVRLPIVVQLMWANVVLFLFNLLPAFPMDGGRMLRAGLAMRMSAVRATDIASRVGKGFALLFGAVGLLYDPFLVFIALFVWLGASGEAASTRFTSALRNVPVEHVMIREYRTLGVDDQLDRAAGELLTGFQRDFPVIDGRGMPVGILPSTVLASALHSRGRQARVGDAMQPIPTAADPHEPLTVAYARMREARLRMMPVVYGGRLAGVLTADNVSEYVMLDAAIRSARDRTA
jgi:Zn-dependent protease